MNTTSDKRMVAIDEIAPNSRQPREFFDEADLERLGKSLQHGQRTPIVVVPCKDGRRPKVKWMIVDGARRWRAARMVGVTSLWIVLEEPMEAEGEQMHEASLVANFCRAGHTHAEKAKAVKRLYDRGKTLQQIGDLVGKSASWAGSYLSLDNLHPYLMTLLDDPDKKKRMPIQVGFALSGVPLDKQQGVWNKHKDRAKADAYHHVNMATSAWKPRDPGKDGDLVLGKLRNALNQLDQLCDMPRAMMKNVSAEKRAAVPPLVEKIRALLEKAVKRISEELPTT